MTRHVNQRGGYTAISPAYQTKLATEQFGSYGEGWGLSVSDFDYTLLDKCGAVIHKAVFFYTIDGKRSEFPITNAIEAVSGKGRFDSDFAKKVETNTISKALSKLGFNADIFMGLFEDQDYVNSVGVKAQIEKADNKDEEIQEQVNKLKTEIQETCQSILLESTKLNAATSMHNKYAVTLQRKRSLIDLQPCADWGLNQIGLALKKKTEESK